jgi:DNA-binding response OmpR family regulator
MSGNGSAKPRVLIVEDEVLVADTLAEMLLELGCEPVGPVATADEAIALVRSCPIDAVVLDLMLHGVDATPVAETLAAKKIPFVLATGWPVESLPLHWGNCPVLPKPYQISSLRSAVEALFDAASSSDP